MKRLLMGLGVLLASNACGPSYGSTGVKTPEERIREQEMLAYEEEQAAKKRPEPMLPEEEKEDEEVGEFDEEQARLELTRATFSAESCTGVVDTEKVRGNAEVTITFAQDGSVSDATIAPFDETQTAKCALRAYKAVIVPPFRGSVKQLTWKLIFEDDAKRKARQEKEKAAAAKAEAEAAKAAEEAEKEEAKDAKKDDEKKDEKKKKKKKKKESPPRLWN